MRSWFLRSNWRPSLLHLAFGAAIAAMVWAPWVMPWLEAASDKLANLRGSNLTIGTTPYQAVVIVDGVAGTPVTAFGGGTQYAEGSVFSPGDTGNMALYVRRDTPAAGTGVANGDRAIPGVSAFGTLQVSLVNPSDGSYPTFATDATFDSALPATGPAVAVRGSAADPTAMTTDNDATALWSDLRGRLHTFAEYANPCLSSRPVNASIASSGTVVISTGANGKIGYLCGGVLVSAAAQFVNLTESSDTSCSTLTAAFAGSITSTLGMSIAANGGFTLDHMIPGASTSRSICLTQSGGNRTAGHITYVLSS